MNTYAVVREQHFNSVSNKVDARRIRNHRKMADKIHAYATKKAAQVGAAAVMADPQSFLQSILSGMLGSLIPIIGPILISIIAPLVIQWIKDTFMKPKGDGGQSVDDMLNQMASQIDSTGEV